MDYANDSKAAGAAVPVAAEDGAFPENYWTIGEMARRYDVSLRTLRFYEDRGLIAPLRHGTTRFYDERCRGRLERIISAKKLVFTLSRIYKMVQAGGDIEIADTLAPGEIAAQINVLERQKADLDRAILDLRAAHSRAVPDLPALSRAG